MERMVNGKYYNPVLKTRLAVYFGEADWTGLVDCLKGLSVRDFRMANTLIGEVFLPVIDEADFWMAFHHLTTYHSKAFLVTVLKAVPFRVQQGTLSLLHNGFIVVSNYLSVHGTAVDKMKFMVHMETAFGNDPEALDYLFVRMRVSQPLEKLDYLLRGEGIAVYYHLFLVLRQLEHDRAVLVRTAHFLMKRGDARSFNLASFLRTYFDLTEVKGTFSLQLNPYELNRLDTSFDIFSKVMRSM